MRSAEKAVKIADILTKRRGDLLSLLGKQTGFIEALDSPVGKEVLKDLLKQEENLLQKIVEETASQEEKAEFRVIKKLISQWVKRISAYLINLNKLGEIQ